MAWRLINVTRNVELTEFASPLNSVHYTHNAHADTSRLNCRIDDAAGVLTIEPEDELLLTDGGVKVFAGYVRQRERTDLGTSGQRVFALGCQDYTTDLDVDPVDQPLVLPAGQSDKQWITTLFTLFGTRGIVLGPLVQQLRASMPADLDVFGLNLHQCLTEIAKTTGGSFYVDFDRRLHYFASESEAAPFGLSDDPNGTTTFDYEQFVLPDDSVEYRNAVFVIGEGVSLWRYRGGIVPAPGTRRAAVINDPTITTVAAAEARGDAFLEGAGDFRQTGSLVTYKPGLRGGMNLQITHSGWGLAAVTFRVTQVEARPISTTRTQYTVRFGGRPVNLADYFGATSSAVSLIGRRVEDVDVRLADLSAAGANMVPNSSFEDGSAWAVGSQWVIGYASADPFFGAKVARVQPVGSATGELLTPFIEVARSDHWWASAWSRLLARTSGVTEMRVHEYAGTTLLETHTVPVDQVEAEWTRRALHFAPAPDLGVIVWNPSTTHVRIGFAATVSPALTWEVDGVQLERGRLLTAYAPSPQELVEGSITGGKLANLGITATKIADGAIETPKLAAGSVIAEKIASAAVITDKLAANAVVTGKLAAAAVTTDKIDASAVTADKIAAGAIDASKIRVGAMTGQSGNLLTNGSFEMGAPSVLLQSGTLAVPAAQAPTLLGGWSVANDLTNVRFMAHSLAKTGTRIGVVVMSNGEQFHRLYQDIPVIAGRTYRLTGWHWKSPGGGVTSRMRLVSMNATKTFLTFGIAQHDTTSPSPQFADMRYTVPTNGSVSWLRVELVSEGTVAGADQEFGWEDVALVEVPQELVNTAGEVKITQAGIDITNGKIVVRNPSGTVVIDGTSNMFKIILAGSVTVPGFSGPGQGEAVVTYFTGVPYRPAHLAYYLDHAGIPETLLLPVTYFNEVSGLVTRSHWVTVILGDNPNETKVRSLTRSRLDIDGQQYRYFIFKEEAI